MTDQPSTAQPAVKAFALDPDLEGMDPKQQRVIANGRLDNARNGLYEALLDLANAQEAGTQQEVEQFEIKVDRLRRAIAMHRLEVGLLDELAKAKPASAKKR